MKHSDTHRKTQKIEATEKTKQALLELIDQKIESDMEKVLEKMDAKFDRFESKLEKIDAVEKSINQRFDNFKWTITVVGIGIALVGLIIKYG